MLTPDYDIAIIRDAVSQIQSCTSRNQKNTCQYFGSISTDAANDARLDRGKQSKIIEACQRRSTQNSRKYSTSNFATLQCVSRGLQDLRRGCLDNIVCHEDFLVGFLLRIVTVSHRQQYGPREHGIHYPALLRRRFESHIVPRKTYHCQIELLRR